MSKFTTKSEKKSSEDEYETLLHTISLKQEKAMKGRCFHSPNDMEQVSREDAKELFEEVDNKRDGSLSLNEVFDWLVRQMKGLPQNQRTQINKYIRLAQKKVDENGDGKLDMDEWVGMMQYISQQQRVYAELSRDTDNDWKLDFNEFSKHKLSLWIEGKNKDEKFLKLVKSKMDEATFTHFLEQGYELSNQLLKGEKDPADAQLIATLKKKLDESYKKISQMEGTIRQLQGLAEEFSKANGDLEAERTTRTRMQDQMDALRSQYEQLQKDSANSNSATLKDKSELQAKLNSTKKDFEDQKLSMLNETRSLKEKQENENNLLRFELIELKESISVKIDQLDSNKHEIESLQNLRNDQEITLKNISEKYSELESETNKFKNSFHEENSCLKLKLQQSVKVNSENSIKITQQDQISKTLGLDLEKSRKEENLLKEQLADLNKCYKEVLETNSNISLENSDLEVNYNKLKQNNELQLANLASINLELKYQKDSYDSISIENKNLKSQNEKYFELEKQHKNEISILRSENIFKKSEIQKWTEKQEELNLKYSMHCKALSSVKVEQSKAIHEHNMMQNEVTMLKLKLDQMDTNLKMFGQETFAQQTRGLSMNLKELREQQHKAVVEFQDKLTYIDSPDYIEMEKIINSKNDLISTLQSNLSNTSANLLNTQKRNQEQESIYKDYEQQKILADDLQNENTQLRPRLDELLHFKIETEKQQLDSQARRSHQLQDWGSPEGRRDTELNTLDAHHLLMSTVEQDMSNTIQQFKHDVDTSFERVKDDYKQGTNHHLHKSQSEGDFNALYTHRIDIDTHLNPNPSKLSNANQNHIIKSNQSYEIGVNNNHFQDKHNSNDYITPIPDHDSLHSTKKYQKETLNFATSREQNDKQNKMNNSMDNSGMSIKVSNSPFTTYRDINPNESQDISKQLNRDISTISYKESNQKLDEVLQDYCRQRNLKFTFQKFSENVQIQGTKCVTLRLQMGDIMARVSGGWISLNKFIEMFEGLEEEKKNIGISYTHSANQSSHDNNSITAQRFNNQSKIEKEY